MALTVKIKTDIPLEGRAYKKFFNSLKSPKTKIEYVRSLLDFAKYKKVKTLDELLLLNPVTLKDNIEDYLVHLKDDRKLAQGTRSANCAALKHFFVMNDVILNWD